MKDNPSNEFNYDEALLYTPGKGRNTWSIYFLGKTDKEETVGFIFRLNISSLPFGFRYIKMYDTVLAITMHDEKYLFGRDFGEFKDKRDSNPNNLSFMCSCSKLFKSSDELQLAACIPHICVNTSVDYGKGVVGLLEGEKLLKCGEKVTYNFATTNIAGNGVVELDGIEEAVRGVAWVEKKHVAFPKGKLKKNNINATKINFIPDGEERRYSFMAQYDVSDEKGEYWFAEMESDGTFNVREIKPDPIHNDKMWFSNNTGISYQIPFHIIDPYLKLDVFVTPKIIDQEVYSPYKRNREGEYIGIGAFEGTIDGADIKGLCTIEMSQ